MAKNSGIIQFTGKLGELVGAQGQDGRTIIRQRRYTIKNPKTDAQCAQRMIFATAGQAVAQLKPILNNSFEGKSFGAKSIQYARSLFLRMLRTAPTLDNNGMVYLPKGSLNFPANAYPLSQGTLQSPVVYFTGDNLRFTGGAITPGSVPSAVFPTIKVGNQITIVVSFTANDKSQVIFCRFAYKDDTLPALKQGADELYYINDEAVDLSLAEGDWKDLRFSINQNSYEADLNSIVAADNITGAAVIISDKVEGKRSTSYLMLNGSASSEDRGGVTAAEALPTYADGASSLNLPSDYYLQNSVSVAE